jgi:hypothetical protein
MELFAPCSIIVRWPQIKTAAPKAEHYSIYPGQPVGDGGWDLSGAAGFPGYSCRFKRCAKNVSVV